MGSMTVMIVDDNQDIRALIRQALQFEGYDVVQAENGDVARRRLVAGEKPHVVLLDMMMPVMDGKQFLEWKNQQPDWANIPVIVISALAGDTTLTGIRGYLRKPIDIDDMMDMIQKNCG